MRTCPNCQSAVEDAALFCAQCGTRIESVVAPSAPAEPANTPRSAAPTVVLPSAQVPATERLPDLDAAPESPNTPGVSSTAPETGALPNLPPDTYATSLPGQPAPVQPPTKQPRSLLWVVIGVISLGLVGVMACVVGGIWYFVNEVGPSIAPTMQAVATSTAGGGVAPQPTEAPGLLLGEPTEVAAPPEESKILFEEDFDSSLFSFFEEDSDDTVSYSFVDGAYQIELYQPNYIVWRLLEDTYENVHIEMDTTFVSGPNDSAVGIIFGYQDSNNFYLFSVAADGTYNLSMYENDEFSELIEWTPSPLIKGQNEVNRIGVEVDSGLIRLYVNGRLLDEISDSTFPEGRLAIASNSFDEAGSTFLIDNLVVYEP
jgi:hypothetical protein